MPRRHPTDPVLQSGPLHSRCDRREFLTRSALSAAALVACASPAPATAAGDSALTARPIGAPAEPRRALPPGAAPLVPGGTPEMLLHVPTGYTPERPAPLVVAFHGAGGANDVMINLLRAHADALGMLVLAPQSVGTTWDFIWGSYGPDVRPLDAALERVFRECNVDPARVALAGFSDGASYALSLGLTNGDLFTRLVAFSPGILSPAARRGKPRLFISHGTRDGVLEIERTSRRFVPTLKQAGYDVTYKEFDGPHTVPVDIARQGAEFVVA